MSKSEIEEYTICEGESALKLTRSVMLALRDGWQPYGPMVLDPTPHATFYQPMVRYVPESA